MPKGKHTEAEMIGALKQMEAGRKAEDVVREAGVSKHTIYAWKAKYGGMVQTALEQNPFSEQVFVFRGRHGDLINCFGWMAAGCACSRSGWSGYERRTCHRDLQSDRHSETEWSRSGGYLRNVLSRIDDYPINHIEELMRWNIATESSHASTGAA